MDQKNNKATFFFISISPLSLLPSLFYVSYESIYGIFTVNFFFFILLGDVLQVVFNMNLFEAIHKTEIYITRRRFALIFFSQGL